MVSAGSTTDEPGEADRPAAEMAEIGIERLRAGDHQEHGAEREQADDAVMDEETRRRTRD